MNKESGLKCKRLKKDKKLNNKKVENMNLCQSSKFLLKISKFSNLESKQKHKDYFNFKIIHLRKSQCNHIVIFSYL